MFRLLSRLGEIMPRPPWPTPIKRAFFDAWIDEADMPDEMWNERVNAFCICIKAISPNSSSSDPLALIR